AAQTKLRNSLLSSGSMVHSRTACRDTDPSRHPPASAASELEVQQVRWMMTRFLTRTRTRLKSLQKAHSRELALPDRRRHRHAITRRVTCPGTKRQSASRSII